MRYPDLHRAWIPAFGERKEDSMRRLVFLVVGVGCLTLIGCGHQAKLILGKWENQEREEVYEFHADGKYDYSGSGSVRRLFGPYQVKTDHVYLEAHLPSVDGEWSAQTTAYKFSVKEDILTLDGVEYMRVGK